MNAQEIKTKGKLVKSWKQMDGAWYEDTFYIYQVGDKFYQLKNHESTTLSGSMSYWDKVTEVIIEKPLPTHIAVILGQTPTGIAYIAEQRQGTPEELAEWATEYINQNEIGRYTRKPQHLTLKMMSLNLV